MLNQQEELEQFEWFNGLLCNKYRIFQYTPPFDFVRKNDREHATIDKAVAGCRGYFRHLLRTTFNVFLNFF